VTHLYSLYIQCGHRAKTVFDVYCLCPVTHLQSLHIQYSHRATTVFDEETPPGERVSFDQSPFFSICFSLSHVSLLNVSHLSLGREPLLNIQWLYSHCAFDIVPFNRGFLPLPPSLYWIFREIHDCFQDFQPLIRELTEFFSVLFSRTAIFGDFVGGEVYITIASFLMV